MSLGSIGTCLKARLMSIFAIFEPLPNLCMALTTWSIVGRDKTNSKSSYLEPLEPLFTELPIGQLKSTITLFLLELALSLVMKGEVCNSKGGVSYGPNIASWAISSQIYCSTWSGLAVADL